MIEAAALPRSRLVIVTMRGGALLLVVANHVLPAGAIWPTPERLRQFIGAAAG